MKQLKYVTIPIYSGSFSTLHDCPNQRPMTAEPLKGTGKIDCNNLEHIIFRLNEILTLSGNFNKPEKYSLQSSQSLICLQLIKKPDCLILYISNFSSFFLCFSKIDTQYILKMLDQHLASILFFRERSGYFRKKILGQCFPQLK